MSAVLSSARGAAALLALAGLATVARSQVPYSLQLSGACDYKMNLNSLIFDLQGNTANGSPFYKARGQDEYIYHDPDCDGGGDGTPRWILDTDEPMPGSTEDLDGDYACSYDARANSFDASRPPFTATWKMKCSSGWVDRFITLLEITSTSTLTTRTRTTTLTSSSSTQTQTTSTETSSSTTATTVTRTSTTVTTTSTGTTSTGTDTSTTITKTETETTTGTGTTLTKTETETSTTLTTTNTTTTMTTSTSSTALGNLDILVLKGACDSKSFLNGLRFVSQGVAANGEPWYKAVAADQAYYIYYDLDCSGAGAKAARWIVDDDAPDASRTQDLDGDGVCNYLARLDMASSGTGPPASADWRMFCADGWECLHLTLGREGKQDPAEHHREKLYLMGACEDNAYLNGLAFKKEGVTAIGAPFYKAAEIEQYLYFDPACDGNAAAPWPRWIIDADAPNSTLGLDLDEDGVCDYNARVDSGDQSGPPANATWRMYCGSAWQEVVLYVTDEMPTMPLVTTTGGPRPLISLAGSLARYPLVLSFLLLVALPVR